MRNIKLKVMPLFLIIILLLAGCNDNSNKQIILTCGHAMKQNHPVAIAIRSFAVDVYNLSKGRIIVKIFPNEELGNENTLIQNTQLGKLDMLKTSTAVLGTYISNYKVLSLPYLYKNIIQYYNVLDGSIGHEILNSGKEYGLLGLTFYNAGARSFYTRNKFIKTPDDLTGMRIRVQHDSQAIEMVKLLGATPIPLPYGEVYDALKNEAIDGAENNIPSFFTRKDYEICKYYSFDKHTMIPDALLISKMTWNKLSKSDQKIILKAADQSFDIQKQIWAKDRKKEIEIMKLNNVEFTDVDENAFYNKVKPMYDELNPKTKKIVDKIRETNSVKYLKE
jgi:tripartite ATP-independent transporter DctP family solute receptor